MLGLTFIGTKNNPIIWSVDLTKTSVTDTRLTYDYKGVYVSLEGKDHALYFSFGSKEEAQEFITNVTNVINEFAAFQIRGAISGVLLSAPYNSVFSSQTATKLTNQIIEEIIYSGV